MRKLLFFLFPLTFIFADYAPVLSSSGKQRLLENIASLDKNITIVKGNIVNCKKNAIVIDSELKELSALEQEHLQLREKYVGQIADIQKELDKNDTAMKELDNFQKNISKNSSSSSNAQTAQQDDIMKSQKDKMDREKWKSEATAKVGKINELIKSVNANLNSIEVKKTPLKEQQQQWLSKEKEYQKLFIDLTAKKEESAKILKTQN